MRQNKRKYRQMQDTPASNMRCHKRFIAAITGIIAIMVLTTFGATAQGTENYDPLAVQRINALITNNGLNATLNAPENWNNFATWNNETPKQLIILNLPEKGLTGAASLEGLTNLRMLFCFFNNLTALDVTGCASLEELECQHNNLTWLNLTGLDNLTDFNASNQSVSYTLIQKEESPDEYAIAIQLNNPEFSSETISYEDGILKSNDNTTTSVTFNVQTGKEGFNLSGTMELKYIVFFKCPE